MATDNRATSSQTLSTVTKLAEIRKPNLAATPKRPAKIPIAELRELCRSEFDGLVQSVANYCCAGKERCRICGIRPVPPSQLRRRHHECTHCLKRLPSQRAHRTRHNYRSAMRWTYNRSMKNAFRYGRTTRSLSGLKLFERITGMQLYSESSVVERSRQQSECSSPAKRCGCLLNFDSSERQRPNRLPVLNESPKGKRI